MRKLLSMSLCAVFIALSSQLRAAETQPAPDPQVTALKKELSDLLKQQEELRRGLEQGEALATLRKVADDSAKEFIELEKTDAALIAAKKAQKESIAEYDQLLIAKTSAGGADLVKQKGVLEDQRQALLLQEQIVDVKLQSPHSSVQRALDGNAELVALNKAYHAIDYKEKAARDAARQKYEEARKAALANVPEAKALDAERAKIKASLAELEKQSKEIDAKLKLVRDELRKGNDAELKAATAKVVTAQKAFEEARDSQKLKAAREAARTASKALSEKLAELLKADPKATALVASIAAKRAQISDLQKPKAK